MLHGPRNFLCRDIGVALAAAVLTGGAFSNSVTAGLEALPAPPIATPFGKADPSALAFQLSLGGALIAHRPPVHGPRARFSSILWK